MNNIYNLLAILGLSVVLFAAGLGCVSLYDRWQISLVAKPLISKAIRADAD